MTEKNKKLDPTKQEDWDKGAKEFGGDFDELVKKSQEKKVSRKKKKEEKKEAINNKKRNIKGVPDVDYGKLEKEWQNKEEKRGKQEKKGEETTGEIKEPKEEDVGEKNENNDNRLVELGKKLKESRDEYVKKEYELNSKWLGIKKFLNKEIDLGNAEEEVNEHKEEYKKVLAEYTEVTMESEEVEDSDDREIMLRYFGISEALKLENEKEKLKLEDSSFSAGLKKFIINEARAYNYVYDNLRRGGEKVTEMVMGKNTKLAKIAKFGGSMVGPMAFSWGIMTRLGMGSMFGVRELAMAGSVAGATLKNKERLEQKAQQEKTVQIEKMTERYKLIAENLSKLENNANEELQKILTEESGSTINRSEKEDIEKTNRSWIAFKKALVNKIFWFGTGYAVGGFFDGDDKSVDIKEPSPVVEAKVDIDENQPSLGGIEKKSIGLVESEIPKVTEVKSAEESPFADVDNSEGEVAVAEVIGATKFEGIELDENGMGDLTIVKGSSIKDTLKEFFIANKDELTAGGMGWDTESGKFSSVEDWAEKRAIGIAGEFAEKMGDYNINKVSVESNIIINLSNTADIRIESLNDPLELGAKNSSPFIETPVEDISSNQEQSQVIVKDVEDLPLVEGVPTKEVLEPSQVTVKNVEDLQPVDGISAEENTGNKTEAVSSGITEEQYAENFAKMINIEAGELKKILFDGNISLWNEIKNHFAIGEQNENFAKFYRNVSNQLELYARPDESVDSWIIRVTRLAHEKGILSQIKNQIPEIVK